MKKNNIKIFLLLTLVLVFFLKIDFFKKTFFLFTKNYNERFIDAYNTNYFSGFCLLSKQEVKGSFGKFTLAW